jgi:hypothetical protein
MDSQKDQDLKSAFSKLRGYEPAQEGIDWKQIEPRLSDSSGKRLSLLGVLLLIGLVGGVFMFPWLNDSVGDSVNKSIVKNEVVKDSTLLEKKNRPVLDNAPAVEVYTKPLSSAEMLQPKRSGSLRIGDSSANESVRTTNQHDTMLPAATQAVNVASLAKSGEKTLQFVNEFQVNDSWTIQPEPTSADKMKILAERDRLKTTEGMDEEVEDDDEKKKESTRTLRWGLSGSYLFGILNPNPSDQYQITNYTFKPGFACQANAQFGITKSNNLVVFIGPVYRFMYKSMYYELTRFGETIESTKVRANVLQHQLGLSISLSIPRYRTDFDVSFAQVLNTQSSLEFGQSWLTTAVSRPIVAISDNLDLTAGVRISTSLSWNQTAFKYYPIELTVGIVRTRKKSEP